eukprot:1629948-Pleurochrysis_carterae.AAC.1
MAVKLALVLAALLLAAALLVAGVVAAMVLDVPSVLLATATEASSCQWCVALLGAESASSTSRVSCCGTTSTKFPLLAAHTSANRSGVALPDHSSRRGAHACVLIRSDGLDQRLRLAVCNGGDGGGGGGVGSLGAVVVARGGDTPHSAIGAGAIVDFCVGAGVHLSVGVRAAATGVGAGLHRAGVADGIAGVDSRGCVRLEDAWNRLGFVSAQGDECAQQCCDCNDGRRDPKTETAPAVKAKLTRVQRRLDAQTHSTRTKGGNVARETLLVRRRVCAQADTGFARARASEGKSERETGCSCQKSHCQNDARRCEGNRAHAFAKPSANFAGCQMALPSVKDAHMCAQECRDSLRHAAPCALPGTAHPSFVSGRARRSH